MKINNVGYNHFHDADFFISRPEGSGDYLMLLLKTAGVFEIGGKEVPAESGSAMLYRPDTPQFYRGAGVQFGNDWFHFVPESREDEQFIAALGIPFDSPVKLESISELSVLVSMMCHEKYSDNIYKTDSADLLIKLFLLKLSEKINMSAKGAGGSRWEKMSVLRTKIYNDPANNWTIDGLAHELTMSRSSFQHEYRRLFGVTPMNDVITARVEYAKYLLTSTDYTVTHIARICGYSSDIHFMRQFRQRTGRRPSELRK
ncbi:AraC family transcriptional regulator [Ruminococcus sp.]|uniref:helix-turn-helix transcriptional regulator n=1 Tax=Ruminococcus sp. TaxID=41978 RepID=UPI0025E57AFB|nr:AraC family transcriptional regulator [Ruminococcus sp.]MBQ8966918.1 helix-turn-helix transcriptional regulator [Ruminococcus sp.]